MTHDWITTQLADERRESLSRSMRAGRRHRLLRTPRYRRLSL